MGFLKRGKEAYRQKIKHDKEAEEREEARKHEVRDFWLKRGESREVTFVDGDVMSNGVLDMNQWFQHGVKHRGRFQKFPCTQYEDDTQPCPLCEDGDYPAFVAAFTVIDHTEYPSNGETKRDAVSLFVAKKQTLQQLQDLATEYGGLAGHKFRIKRSNGETSPAVGDIFTHLGKRKNFDAYLERRDIEPTDYELAVNYHTPEKLRSMGFGDSDSKHAQVVDDEGFEGDPVASEEDYYDDEDEFEEGSAGAELEDEDVEDAEDEEIEEDEPQPAPVRKKASAKKAATKKVGAKKKATAKKASGAKPPGAKAPPPGAKKATGKKRIARKAPPVDDELDED